jgi:protein SCO1/2
MKGLVLAVALGSLPACKAPPEPPTREEVLASTAWRAPYEAWQDGQPIPSFWLVDQSGQPFQLGELSGSYLLIGFVFSRCGVPEACPRTMRKLAEVRDGFADKKARGETRGRSLALLSVTLDPDNDTPEVLKAYGKHYGADGYQWRLVTGHPELVSNALPSLFNVMAFPDGQGSIGHTVKVALVGPGLKPIAQWLDNAFAPEEVLARMLE